jgi:hypothetical protein
MKSKEENGAIQRAAAGPAPRTNRRANVAPRRAPVASGKAKAGNKPTPAKQPVRRRKQAESGRERSKTAKVLDLLKRPGGVTAEELLSTTGWQPHSLRGFLSGTVRKKMGLTLISTKGDDGNRTYFISV